MIEIINARKQKPSEKYDIWIDRRSPVGNPYTLIREDGRDNICDSYDEWFKGKLTMKDSKIIEYLDSMFELYKSHGRLRLFCWCVPKRCHGETIKKYIEEELNYHEG